MAVPDLTEHPEGPISRRDFLESFNSRQIRMGDALKDPLLIKFGGNAAQLTGTEFLFDLDSDGTQESVSSVES